jgi:dihydroxyacetone kinase-like protein
VFDQKTFRALFALFRAKFESERDRLNELDAAVGDGDHGFTIERSFRAAEIATRTAFADLGRGFDAAAQALAENAGGAIGPLLAAFFAEGGVVFKGKQAIDLPEILAFFEGGLASVMAVGGAKQGDKTMIDAMIPAIEALKSHQYDGLETAFTAAADAAMQGALNTRNLVAEHGRAHFLGDRSKGYQDAGATSFALIVAIFLAAIQGQDAPEFTSEKRRDAQELTPPPGKLINHPDDMITEDIEGQALAFPHLLKLEDGILVRAKSKSAGKVGLAIGHGGGHTPSMGGMVGPGLLDADVYGPVFTCASGVRIKRAIELADRGAGVVLLVSNHSGDVLNARLAARRAAQEGIQVKQVLLGDDIATAPRDQLSRRRGLGGMLFALKVGGAAAEASKTIDEVARLMEKTNERTATLAVAISPPTHPATGEKLFTLPKGEIEIGTGVHGEVGIYRGPHLSADAVVDLLVEKLTDDLKGLLDRRVLVFINGSGGTSKMELHILFRRVHQALAERGIEIAGSVVEPLFTTQEMGGFSLSLCAVDDELLTWWNEPASGPAFRWPYA